MPSPCRVVVKERKVVATWMEINRPQSWENTPTVADQNTPATNIGPAATRAVVEGDRTHTEHAAASTLGQTIQSLETRRTAFGCKTDFFVEATPRCFQQLADNWGKVPGETTGQAGPRFLDQA